MSLSTWFQGSSWSGIATAFQTPPIAQRPMVRWWWPHGVVEIDELKREINQMHAAGFGGAEVEDVHFSLTIALETDTHGWGSQPWIDAVLAVAEYAESLKFSIDIGLGPSYPAAVPTLAPDDPGASKEVVTGRIILANGTAYDGIVPAPYAAPGPRVTNQTLVQLHAWRVGNSSKPTAVPTILNYGSMVDLTFRVSNGHISFTPPDNATWVIISYWYRGTGQIAEGGSHNDPDGAVIDHIGPAGIQASTDYWDQVILSKEMKNVFKRIGGSFFEDSLELTYNTLWTPTLHDEFKKRTGYDIYKVLPAIALENQKNAFSFDDAEITRGVINDYWDVMGDLYIENHAQHMTKWAHSHGMKFRAQVYGLPTNAMSAAAALDIPEGETLGFKNLGDYRSLAGAANMKGLNLISNEACAFATSAYTVTWDLVLQTLNPVFTTGNNHQVFHGFSYLAAPTAQWPGFAAFTPYKGTIGYAESWGPRIPIWKHAKDIMDYVSRMQVIMQSGIPQHDVVFFEQKGYMAAGYNSPWFGDLGMEIGWSLNIIDDSALHLPSAVVKNGRFAPDGPAYKLFAFEGDAYTSTREAVVKWDTAKAIHAIAKTGLPMLIIGNWTVVHSYGYGETALGPSMTAIFADILSMENVVNVATRDNDAVAAGMAILANKGVVPDVRYNTSQLINYHRKDGVLDHYLFVAASTATFAVTTKTPVHAVDADVYLPRQSKDGVPVIMNLWTGEMTPLGKYVEVSDKEIMIHVSLLAYQSMMITVAPLGRVPVHATTSTAQLVHRNETGLYLRSNISGNFETELSTGDIVRTAVSNVPPALELHNWTLSVQSYEPTADLNSTDTIFRYHTLQGLDTLAAWNTYPELLDVSGIGNYSTTFNLGNGTWPADAGAVISIPSFTGSFRMTINGVQVPPVDQLDNMFDIGKYVKAGINTLQVEVATPLLNRVRVTEATVYGGTVRQAYGLISPIKIMPYREFKISSR